MELKVTIFAADGKMCSRITDVYTVSLDVPKSVNKENIDAFVEDWINKNLRNVNCFRFENPFEKDEYLPVKETKSKKGSSRSDDVDESANKDILEKLQEFGEIQYDTKSGDFVKIMCEYSEEIIVIMPESLMPKIFLSALDDIDMAIVTPTCFVKHFPSNIIDFSTECCIEDDGDEKY